MTIVRMFSSYADDKISELKSTGSAKTFVGVTDQFYCSPRNNQQYILDNYLHSNRFIMNQPPGSGKSIAIGFAMAKRLTENPNEKVIIAVPQTLIAKSFGKTILKYNDESVIEWDISNNFCESWNGSKTSSMKRFLNQTTFTTGIYNRIAICTHATLALIHNELKKNPSMFDNVTLIIDEAHHVLYPNNGNAGKTYNSLGQLIESLLIRNHPSFSLWLVTATFYRGDKGTIIPDSILNDFDRYFLPLDQHWKENIKYIKSFNLDFAIYENSDPIPEVKEILSLGKKKTIIYCPYTGHLIGNSSKIQFRNRLIKAIREIWPECNIMDLITPNGRDQRKQIMLRNETAKDIDIILSVKMFDEGSDWIYAEQVLNLVPSDSLRIENQRFGRLWRDLPGKEEIYYYIFLTKESKFKNEEERRKHCSKATAALSASLLLHEIIEPIKYPSKPLKKTSNKPNQTQLIPVFETEVPNEQKRRNIIAEVTKDLMFLANLDENPPVEKVKETIKQTLTKNGIINHQNEIITHITKMLRRHQVRTYPIKPNWDQQVTTIDVDWMVEAGFDKVWDNSIFHSILTYTTGTCGIETFKEFREIYGDRKSVEEWIEIVEELAKQNGGELPPISTLSSGMQTVLKKYPEKFTHIPIKNLNEHHKSPEDWVKIAEQLAKENGGELPSASKLINQGWATLVNQLSANSELFKHIKRKYEFRTLEEWVKFAEELAEQNNNKLPSSMILRNNYPALLNRIGQDPKAFSHIPRTYLINNGQKPKNIKEWVKIAEELVEQNGGKLPPVTYLRNTEFDRITRLIYTNPEEFNHIPRENLKSENGLDEWVKFAEELAEQNGGKIPRDTDLVSVGFGTLRNWLRNYPESFKHLKQERGRLKPRSKKQWAELAPKLAEDNGGVLPSISELLNSEYRGLAAMISKHPQLFDGLKQYYKGGKGHPLKIRTIKGKENATQPIKST